MRPGRGVRHDDAIGARELQLLLRVGVGSARDDLDVRPHGARRQSHVEVVGVVVGGDDDAARALDAGLLQVLVFGRVTEDQQLVVLLRGIDRFLAVVEHDERHARGAKLVGHLTADAAVAADDEVVAQVLDRSLPSPFRQNTGQDSAGDLSRR